MAESKAAPIYPDLNSIDLGGDDDILEAISESKRKRPPRPPPPRAQSLPARAIDAVLDDDRMDIPGYEPPPPYTPPLGVVNGQTNQSGTVSIPPPLTPDKIRWFYQEPGKFWQPFSGPDSLCLEQCHSRLVGGDLIPCDGGEVGLVQVMGDLFEANVLDRTCRHIYWTDMGTWPILRGYWYEVIGDKWYPIPEQEHERIEQVHTDKQWREKVRADDYLGQWAETVNGSKVNSPSQPDGPAKPAKQEKQNEVILHKVSLDRYEVLWTGCGDVRKLKKEMSTQLWNKVGSKLGKGQSYGATKLVRGYKEEATMEDKLPPIGHLVFVVHGIGQSMDMSCINKSATDFRQTCTEVARKQFGDKWAARRVEFIPVEWRTWLTLDKGILSTITPHGVKKLRSMFNDSVLDVLYYMSPKFGPEIRDGLRFAIHKQYNEFMRRHPTFLPEGGTVSILAHSLGSVISYDLLLETCEAKGLNHFESEEKTDRAMRVKPSPVELRKGGGVEGVAFKAGLSSLPPTDEGADETDSTHRGPDGLLTERRELEALRKRVAELELKLGERRKPQGLEFFVDHFFALGSPLAVFLMMREHDRLINKSYKSAESLLPSCVCSRIHNVNHPSDPVAYRLEPLVNPLYAQIKPVRIDSVNKISKEAIDHAEGPSSKPPPQTSQGKSWLNSALSLFGSSNPTPKKASPEPSRPKTAEKLVDNDKHLKPDERLKERLDFMMKESFAESSYINSLTAHTGYWTSNDCAQYILLQLYSYKRNKVAS